MSFLSDIGSKFGPALPSGQTVLSFVFFIIIFFAIIVILGLVIFAISYKRKYYMTIQTMTKIDGRIQRDKIYKAMDVRLNRSGDRVIFIRGAKRYMPRPTKQVGPHVYLYFVTEDDQWLNVDMQDIDLERGQIKFNYLDKEMRMSHIATERAIDRRHQKEDFWQKYGALIVYVMFIVLTLAAFIFVARDLAKVTSQQASITESLAKLAERLVQAQGGTGITPAPPA